MTTMDHWPMFKRGVFAGVLVAASVCYAAPTPQPSEPHVLSLYEVTTSAQNAPAMILRDRKGRQFYAKKGPLAVLGRAAVEEARVYRMGIVASETDRHKFDLPVESFAVDFKLTATARDAMVSQLADLEGRLIAVLQRGIVRGWVTTSPFLLTELKMGTLSLSFDALDDARETARLLRMKVRGPDGPSR